MSEEENNFLQAREEFRTNLQAYGTVTAEGFKELALENERQAAHRANKDNPHNLTKASINLELLENRAPATLQDVIDLTNLDRMATPETLAALAQDPRMVSGAVVNAVRTPKPVSPISGEVVPQTNEVVLEADTYRHMYSRVIDGTNQRIPRETREFEIWSTDPQATDPLWTGSIDNDSITAPITLTRHETYRWHCRDKSIDGEYSQWSPLERFQAPGSEVVPPSVMVEGGTTEIRERPMLSSSAFTTNGDGDTHVSTTWRIYFFNAGAPLWEVTSTEDLTSIRVPKDVLYPGSSFQVEVIHTSASAGNASSGRLAFSTMAQFPLHPGPVDIVVGDETLGYYGEVLAEDFVSGDLVTTESGFGGGSASPWSSTTSWVKLSLDGNVVYLARYPIRYGFNLADIDSVGLTGAGKEITLKNTVFRIRNLGGLKPVDPDLGRLGSSPGVDVGLTGGSEWDRVMNFMFTWLGAGNDTAAIGITDTYRHNVVAEQPSLDIDQPLIVRGGGQHPVGDSRRFTYVNKSTDGSTVPYTVPQWVSWRPMLVVV